MKPILSIITITYNDGPGLEKTIQSLSPLFNDKSVKWEHVIVDSSPEVNSPILNKLRGWPLGRIETPPRGIYPAFNLGIEHVHGQFVWFLNSGDRLLSVKNLKSLLDGFVKDTSIDLIGTPVEMYRDHKFIYKSQVKMPLISNLLGQNSLCHQGIIYRRSVFDRVGKFNESFKLAGDYDHHFRCYFKDMVFKTTSWVITQYDRDGRSDNYREVFKEYKKVWKDNTPSLDFIMRCKNDFFALIHFLTLRAMKSKLLQPISKPLKSIWYQLH